MTQNRNEIQTIKVLGKITNTSNKGQQFDGSPVKYKTLYLELDKDSTQRAIDFGMREYTSRQGGDNFFIVQPSSKGIKVYDEYEKEKLVRTVSASVEEPNFTTDEKIVEMAIMKGYNKGNDFYRLFAVLGDEIVENESASPFA